MIKDAAEAFNLLSNISIKAFQKVVFNQLPMYLRIRKLLLLSMLLTLNLFTNAQSDSLVRKRDSLFYTKPFFSFYPKIFNNGQRLEKEETEGLFRTNPMALNSYIKYRQHYKTSLYSFAGGFAGIVVSGLAFNNGNRPLAGGSLVFTVASWINYVVFATKGESNLRKAIYSYNQYSLH